MTTWGDELEARMQLASVEVLEQSIYEASAIPAAAYVLPYDFFPAIETINGLPVMRWDRFGVVYEVDS